jgi:GMP synthase (glutamine-hydrolysing)
MEKAKVALVVDNLSPFTPEIVACLDRLGLQSVCKKFSDVAASDVDSCERVILSGRRRNDPAINAANSRIVMRCRAAGTPLLGICYGAEILALTLGGSIKRMPRPVQGPITVTVEPAARPNPLTGAKPAISVYESHGFCVARLPEGFEAMASSQYCEYEIFGDRAKKIFGTQFHPEKSGQDGQELIASFAALSGPGE